MNDRPQNSENPAPTSRSDNYRTYLDDEYGYTYAARDILPLHELESHDALRADPESAGDPGDLNDFELLGLARGWHDHGDSEAFYRTINRIFGSQGDHPAVDYAEVHLLCGKVLSDADRHDEAIEILEQCADNWADMRVPAGQLSAIAAVRSGDDSRASAIYDDLVDSHPDDAEMLYEFAEDLWSIDRHKWAAQWLDRATELAEKIGDRALLVDIELLREKM